MARRRATAPATSTSANGWIEYDLSRTVGDVLVDPETVPPIAMPVRPPTEEERLPKTGSPSPVFDLSEGMSSEPSVFPTAAASTTRAGNTRLLPYSAVGKLISHFGNAFGSGSAFVLGYRTIFTAAHCVGDNPKLIEFIPNVGPGEPTPRRWQTKFVYVHRGYAVTQNRDLRCDFAVCITDPEADPVMPTTGSLG